MTTYGNYHQYGNDRMWYDVILVSAGYNWLMKDNSPETSLAFRIGTKYFEDKQGFLCIII